MRALAVLLTLSTSSVRAFGAEGWRARAAYNQQNADTYSGDTTSLGLGYAHPRGYNLGLNTDLMNRRYAGGASLHDDQVGATASIKTGDHVYVDVTATTATTANIFARWAAIVVPHYVLDANDFGLGLRFADYKTGRAGGLNPSYLHYFRNGLALGGGAYVIRTNDYISSYTAQALFAPTDHHAVRVVGAAGRVLEDRGLEAQFNSLSLEYTYTCTARFSVGLGLTDYWSQIRRERVVGFRLGWR